MSADRSHARGYALILAAVVVALLALVLLAVARVQGDVSPGLRALQRDVEREIATHSAVARVGYLLLTEPIGPRSVVVGGPREPGAASSAGMRNARELRLDGRFYVIGGFEPGADAAFASVQDEAGLLSLNTGDSVALGALLDQAGVANARGLASALVDYIDEDDLAGPYGAEEDAYRRLHLPPPLNQPLTNRWRALDALGWRESVNEGSGRSFLGKCERGAARRIAQREHRAAACACRCPGQWTRGARPCYATRPGRVAHARGD